MSTNNEEPERANLDDPPPSGFSAPPGPTYDLAIGDIGIVGDTITTPNGTAPLAGSIWIATDRTVRGTRIPTVAIVLAIVFALFCLLGLLFLLMKEEYTTGYVEVSVRSGDLFHVTQIPVNGDAEVQQVRYLVGQAQSMAARA